MTQTDSKSADASGERCMQRVHDGAETTFCGLPKRAYVHGYFPDARAHAFLPPAALPADERERTTEPLRPWRPRPDLSEYLKNAAGETQWRIDSGRWDLERARATIDRLRAELAVAQERISFMLTQWDDFKAMAFDEKDVPWRTRFNELLKKRDDSISRLRAENERLRAERG